MFVQVVDHRLRIFAGQLCLRRQFQFHGEFDDAERVEKLLGYIIEHVFLGEVDIEVRSIAAAVDKALHGVCLPLERFKDLAGGIDGLLQVIFGMR